MCNVLIDYASLSQKNCNSDSVKSISFDINYTIWLCMLKKKSKYNSDNTYYYYVTNMCSLPKVLYKNKYVCTPKLVKINKTYG